MVLIDCYLFLGWDYKFIRTMVGGCGTFFGVGRISWSMIEAMNARRGDEYYTPEWVYSPLGYFDADYCAGPGTCVAARNYTRDDDGLSMEWNGFVWCNPPFSAKQVWIRRMKAHDHGIMLLPASPSTPWFSDLANHCGHVFFIGRKVNFVGGTGSNFGGSCLFPFGLEGLSRLRTTSLVGYLMGMERFTGHGGSVGQLSLF